jgi:hypothetical protein
VNDSRSIRDSYYTTIRTFFIGFGYEQEVVFLNEESIRCVVKWSRQCCPPLSEIIPCGEMVAPS